MLEVKAQYHQMMHRTVFRDFIFPVQHPVKEILAGPFTIQQSATLGTGFDFNVMDLFIHKEAS